MSGFHELGIGSEITEVLEKNGVMIPTPIQEKAIPVLLEGKDVLARAQTGTGKTLAFLLPILERTIPSFPHVQTLILAPTRELALQITTEAQRLTADRSNVHVLAVYGGQDVVMQLNKLQKNVHVVIATPGRLLDHLRRGSIALDKVSMLVLDEVDQMLHMGFLTEVEEIVLRTPIKRQTMMFSATIPESIQKLAKKYMNHPQEIHVQTTAMTLEEIKQAVVETTDRAKQTTLRELIDVYRPYLAVIFCRTKRRASKLNQALQAYGYRSDELHGDLSQSKREEVMRRFREAEIQLLVATDVAARGLDIEGVTHVFNYDIPHDAESYIHRIGRTGRAGGTGVALTLVADKDQKYLRVIETGIEMRIKRKVLDRQKKHSAVPHSQQQNKDEDRSKKATYHKMKRRAQKRLR